MKKFLIVLSLALGIAIFFSACTQKTLNYDDFQKELKILAEKYDNVEFFNLTESHDKEKVIEFKNVEEFESFIEGVIENMSK